MKLLFILCGHYVFPFFLQRTLSSYFMAVKPKVSLFPFCPWEMQFLSLLLWKEEN